MPDLALMDELVLVNYMSGDEGARDLIDQLLAGEVTLALTTSTALEMWCHEIADRKTEIHVAALMRFIEQLPLTGDLAKSAGSIYPRNPSELSGDGENNEQMVLKSVIAATALDSGMPIYSRDVDWYESHGCEVLAY